jgi:hypothetical protein
VPEGLTVEALILAHAMSGLDLERRAWLLDHWPKDRVRQAFQLAVGEHLFESDSFEHAVRELVESGVTERQAIASRLARGPTAAEELLESVLGRIEQELAVDFPA